ncbi:MAG: hypothetical protein WBD40_00750 [Tepidisphaeraceae bacterium]
MTSRGSMTSGSMTGGSMTSDNSVTSSGAMTSNGGGMSSVEGGRKRSRVAIVAIMIVALVAAGFTRHMAESQRGGAGAGQVQTGANLSNMNSFALALLLGGLRGPLVMLLWTSSEGQKTEKNLEDFDTKVEWIRLLQPEFDTVHIFQIWNKAYNVSVQMASNANKYTTILDALEYAKNVDRERPSNINILYAIGSVYFDKLGGASEKQYYRGRVRDETKPHKAAEKLNRADPGWRPLKMDAMLDEKGMLLPQYLDVRSPRPASLKADSPWNTDAELQYLEPYQPFPYGISPQALGYNYFKRAQVLQDVGKQRHAQISDLVIDSRPGLSLRMWGEEEMERARKVELAAFGKEIPTERIDLELPTADIAVNQAPAAGAVQEALFEYERAGRLFQDALKEYERHLQVHAVNRNTYEFHVEHLENMIALVQGDHDYLAAQLATGSERDRLIASATEHYKKSLTQSEYMIVRYHIDDQFVAELFPPGTNRLTADQLTPEQYAQIIMGNRQILRRPGVYDAMAEDRTEYERYATRAAMRLEQLAKATKS